MNEPYVAIAPADLDAATAERFRNEVAELYVAGVTSLVIDLTDTRFIDSSGIGTLIAVTKRAAALGIDLAMRNPSERVSQVLRMSGASRVLTIRP